MKQNTYKSDALRAETFAIFAFLAFSRKFLPWHNLNSKFAKVFARKIIENSRHAKIFCVQFFLLLQVFTLLSLITPIFSLLGYNPCKLSP